MPELSIVTTLYNSSATIDEFYRRSVAAAEAITSSFEIVIVDDGSPDESLAVALRLVAADDRVKVVELSRNFGHHKALMTGMDFSRGRYCLLIDSDLEEPPETLRQLWDTLHESGVDVVYGYQSVRGGSLGRRLSGTIAYFLMNVLIAERIPRNHITLRLMKRAYVDALLQHREHRTAIGGLWIITGFRQAGLPVKKLQREEAAYSFRHRWHMLIDSITSFSDVPLVAIFYLGIVILVVATFVSAWLLGRKLIYGVSVAGWLSVMLSVWFLGGLAIFCIGVVGIYLSKIFIETKNRPYTIVREVHSLAPQDTANAGVTADH